MTGNADVVIVGESSDLHLKAVLEHLSKAHLSVVVFDADSLTRNQFRWTAEHTLIGTDGPDHIGLAPGIRGWVRRLTPPFWQRGTTVESIEAAEATAKLALLGGILRTSGVSWLTDVDSLMIGESKMLQASVATKLGIPYPPTVATDEVGDLDHGLFPAVLKPLGPSHYFDNDQPRFVAVDTVERADPKLAHLRAAPFLLQKAIIARHHWRIVTVGDEVWASRLDARELPTDWRSAAAAHHNFVAATPTPETRQGALAIANAMSLGYSSQDWIDDGDCAWLVDVNPAGQWLFLPDSIGNEISAAIARWLGRSQG